MNIAVYLNEASLRTEKQDENGFVYRIQVAKAGPIYHPADPERKLELTEFQFREMVANLEEEGRTNRPVYFGHPEVDGRGDVPRIGYITGGEVENGSLFLYVRPLEALQAAIKEGTYAYCSIYFDPISTHKETGEEIGAQLLSLAITNQPVIENMREIQKSEVIYLSHIAMTEEYKEQEKKQMSEEELEQLASKVAEILASRGMAEGAEEEEEEKAMSEEEEKKEEEALAEGQDCSAHEEVIALVKALLGLDGEVDVAEVIEALKAQVEAQSGGEEAESLSEMRINYKSLKNQMKKIEVEDYIKSSGKIPAEEVEAYTAVGLSSFDQLKKLVEKRSSIALTDRLVKTNLKQTGSTDGLTEFEKRALQYLNASKK